jgi:hypothetical protein
MSPSKVRLQERLRRMDWRGWIALAWAIYWGVNYCGMVVRARGDRIKDWFKPHQVISASAESKGIQGSHGRSSVPVAAAQQN